MSSPVMPLLPPVFRPKAPPRSKSQPNPPISRGAIPTPNAPPLLPPPPPILPPKPLGARPPSFTATRVLYPQPKVTPSAKPRPAENGPGTDDANSPTLPPVAAPVKGQFGMNEEEELELALELSVHVEREHANSLLSQDEDLARALEESLRDSPPPPAPERLQPRLVVDVANVPSASSSSTRLRDAPSQSHDPKRPTSRVPSPLPAPAPVDAQLKEDEALARRLEAEYENGRTTPTAERERDDDSEAYPDERPGYVPLPPYADVVGEETAVKRPESDATASPRVPPQVSPTTSVHADERLSVPNQANVPPRNTPSPAKGTSPKAGPSPRAASPAEEAEAPESSSAASPPSSRTMVTPNQFVEPELLHGVSFGFHTPPMQNLEMRGPLPNIIALPYGKSPPMHIRAASWRQLLKLMAKLSATRLEPSVESVAVTKGDLLLRTVVQFFRLHPTSSDWRTVVYLTIDYPPPPDHRYTNGDVNVLPYSYTLSHFPALLRDGADSPICKYYTVPVTPRTPLPKLPISMPDMAMYLASALEESRRALNDSSSGHRRLAKMIDQFYPKEQGPAAVGEEEEVRRRGGRAFIGRLMGRSSRPQLGRNAEVYDLVTPFVPDEWG
ncbi:hypothetical protein F5148DRAFT_1279978 [Russula earlei]|uniref:Uncharacterized protein n=1 Tax=Russula earlei TaxID=71964 RepID=A0ACC0UKI9_9AGAM|nr:hypothetical protein F5148DRAFT_1279978 [Russula earlei]